MARPLPHWICTVAVLGAVPVLGACATPAPEPGAYADALAAVAADPVAGAARCTALRHPDARGDCTTAAAEGLAPTDATAAAALCDTLTGTPLALHHDECHFQVAERAGKIARCAAAGRFADDCRLHLLSGALGSLLPKGAQPGSFEAALGPELVELGFAEDDLRPWSAAYRWVLGSQRPLDLHSCGAVERPELAEACARTGVAHFQDLLNHARDTGTFPCDGGPLTGRLAHVPHPDLDAVLATRRGDDLCPTP